MLYGYIRVSAANQHAENQIPALIAAGVEPANIFVDHAVSGMTKGADRPALAQLLAKVQPGDSVTVYAVSRVGRNMRDVMELIHELQDRGVGFSSVSERFELNTTMGQMFLALLAGFAQMEREQMLERQAAGIASARARGSRLGRKPALTEEQRTHARRLAAEGRTQREIARLIGTSKGSVQRALEA